ncbi:MAG: hydroxysqualene dehydroxylase HpnE [Bryobacterales bacterium]|nr:hydroxysqualene dehydroxylase HpnE [Bryobacterales bacterium]
MRVAIAGGGLSGLSAAWVLAEQGFDVDVYESRRFPGGRAASYEVPDGDGRIRLDNSQHILMRCCGNLQDLYRRLGIEHLVEYYSQFTFLEPGGRSSTLRAGLLPAPLHFAEAFAGIRFLSLADKLSISRGMIAVRRDVRRGPLLDTLTMGEWLRGHGQTENALRRFWAPVLVSAVNETLEVMSAWQGIRLIYLGFLAGKGNYEMGVPKVLLGDLYAADHFARQPRLHLHLGSAVTGFREADGRLLGIEVNGEQVEAGAFVSALPFERLCSLFPSLETGMCQTSHSPIAGIHLRFRQPVTNLPHAALLDRNIQWFFAKEGGTLLSYRGASRTLETMGKQEIVDLALKELAEFLPEVGRATLTGAWVTRETKATFVASPGFEARRPGPRTRLRNFFLAGDWTNTGWPSTMEGAVISGYRAAEAICQVQGIPARFVVDSRDGGIR